MPRKSKLVPYLDKLGIVPDKQLADIVGLSIEAVRKYRQRHDIPARWRGEGEPLPVDVEAQPAPAPRKRSRPARRRKSKLDPHMDKVGVLPDKQVAMLAGVTPENVRAYRIRRGIPARWRGEGGPLSAAAAPAPAPAAPKRASKPRKGKLTPYLAEIGILEDAVIARKAATTPQNVRNFRMRHGIPARWRGEGEALPGEAEVLQAAAAPAEEVVPESDLPPEPEEAVPLLMSDPTPEEPAKSASDASEPADELPSEPEDHPTPEVVAEPASVDAFEGDPAVSDLSAETDDELPPKPEDTPALRKPARPALQRAYSVTVEGPEGEVEYVATGADIGEAATKAVAALGEHGIEGTVAGIRFLAQALT